MAAKNISNLISVLTICWCPCVESSLVLLEVDDCYDQYVLLWKLLTFAQLHFVLQDQTCMLLQVSLDLLLLHSSPLWWKLPCFWCFRRYCKSSKLHSTSASAALVFGAWTWVTVILNGLPCKRPEIILLFLRLHPSAAFWTLVDCEGYSISSKGFLTTVVDIMVTWIKFIHTSLF